VSVQVLPVASISEPAAVGPTSFGAVRRWSSRDCAKTLARAVGFGANTEHAHSRLCEREYRDYLLHFKPLMGDKTRLSFRYDRDCRGRLGRLCPRRLVIQVQRHRPALHPLILPAISGSCRRSSEYNGFMPGGIAAIPMVSRHSSSTAIDHASASGE